MRVTLESAYVLHRRPWRDSSLILDVLTSGHGRLALAARGARRPKARLHGLLQPFSPLLLSWSMRGDMGTLTGAEGAGGLALRGRALISGFYVNELLTKLLARHDAHPGLFVAYGQVLRALAAPDESPDESPGEDWREQRALRLFEKALLGEIGYGLVLDHEVTSGAPIADDEEYDYYPDRGPVGVGAGRVDGVREVAPGFTIAPGGRALRLRGRTLSALARGELEDVESLREVKGLMRLALGVCLGHRPLHSRALFRPPAVAAAGPGEDIGGEEREGGGR